jgi:hypothetical protein
MVAPAGYPFIGAFGNDTDPTGWVVVIENPPEGSVGSVRVITVDDSWPPGLIVTEIEPIGSPAALVIVVITLTP